jgi:hypothetical protein
MKIFVKKMKQVGDLFSQFEKISFGAADSARDRGTTWAGRTPSIHPENIFIPREWDVVTPSGYNIRKEYVGSPYETVTVIQDGIGFISRCKSATYGMLTLSGSVYAFLGIPEEFLAPNRSIYGNLQKPNGWGIASCDVGEKIQQMLAAFVAAEAMN